MKVLLSQTASYAVRATIHLAEREGPLQQRPLRLGEIAAAVEVPRNYLSKILHQLTRAGVLVSERGPHGGFRLAAASEEISLLEVLEAVEPRHLDWRCLLRRPECTDRDPCPAHHRWRPLADDITDFLEETTLADLRRPPRRAKRTRAQKAPNTPSCKEGKR